LTGLALPRPGASRGGDDAARVAESAPTPLARLAAEVVVFIAAAALAAGHWSRLVADAPSGGLLGAVAIAALAAAVLGALGLSGRRGPAVWASAAVVTAAALAASMAAVGWPTYLLGPENWGELMDKLGLGLAGVEDVEMPYAGGDEWVRLTLLTGAPLGLVAAAAFGFWPARRRGAARVAGLVCIVAIYGIAVTLDSPGSELLWGVPLLLCVVAWIWLPSLPARRAAIAAATALAAALVALPAAARLDTAAAWWDYESWDWFGRDREVSFQWNHSYGPLDWPREGTTLLDVRSNEPLYWKASVLDRFDGFTWQRADASDPLAASERLARRRAPGSQLAESNRQWLTQASFEVEALESELVVGTGTTMAVQGMGEVARSRDGTLTATPGTGLAGGDEYSIVSYVPQPTPAELRGAPGRYPARRFADQVLVGLPTALAPRAAMAMPLWGERDEAADTVVEASPYAQMYGLARQLTAGAQHPYDATLAIEQHLSASYDYTPIVDEATHPLAAFLERDKAGYCQQFAGTMALMLRMVGIPSRVVSGFAPGGFDSGRGVYEVRDYDAHAWVEVYFRGIGWVTFDPTPAAAPAASRDEAAVATTQFRGRGSVPEQPIGRALALEAALEGGTLTRGAGDGGGALGPVAAGTGVLAAVAGMGAGVVFLRRRSALARGELAEAQVAELRRALVRMGWDVPPDATLLELERRFRGVGRRGVASYLERLRAHRYAPRAPGAPGPGDRRALRQALGAGGLRRRARALFAIPPGGPAAGIR
jgi:protein-glutamine gamma-glutamyltransferase